MILNHYFAYRDYLLFHEPSFNSFLETLVIPPWTQISIQVLLITQSQTLIQKLILFCQVTSKI